MQKTLTLFTALICAASLAAQAPYTTKQYGWRIEKDLEYGVELNYAGIPPR